jgi:hypothetical protein
LDNVRSGRKVQISGQVPAMLDSGLGSIVQMGIGAHNFRLFTRPEPLAAREPNEATVVTGAS